MYVDPNKKSHFSDHKQPFYRYWPIHLNNNSTNLHKNIYSDWSQTDHYHLPKGLNYESKSKVSKRCATRASCVIRFLSRATIPWRQLAKPRRGGNENEGNEHVRSPSVYASQRHIKTPIKRIQDNNLYYNQLINKHFLFFLPFSRISWISFLYIRFSTPSIDLLGIFKN